MWHTGSGSQVEIEYILEAIDLHSQNGGNVFVGCDSQLKKRECIFSTVICLHGAENQQGGIYFFNREKLKKKSFPSMLMRLTKEVEKSVEMALLISEIIPEIDVEIHIDASTKETEKTSRFADMLRGYARGAGFKCKLKPDAWASNSIADKHSK